MEIRSNIDPDLLFKGRPGDPRLGEVVATGWPLPTAAEPSPVVCLIGAPDHTGVVLNRGRPGAAQGPAEIRRELYRMTPPMDGRADFSLLDAGDVIPGAGIVETHARAQALCESALGAGRVVIALGGGNDFSSPHARALREVTAANPEFTGTIGIITVDPHLDVRPRENGLPHSGSPYRDLIDSGVIDPRNLIEFGTRRNRNAAEHYRYCREKGVVIHEYSRLQTTNPLDTFAAELKNLTARCDAIMLSIDLDCCAGITGVSAPGALGFTPDQLCQMAACAADSEKTRLLEIVECAPPLDPTGMTQKVAAELAYSFLINCFARGESS